MRTNQRTKFLDLFIARLLVCIALAAGLAWIPSLGATVQALSVQTCAPGTHQVAGQCTPDPQPVALATDSATDDARAEGRDVLPTSYRHAPWDLWNALAEQMPGSYDDDVPGIGTFYVPVGSVVEGDTRRFLATLDGWAQIHKTRTSGVYVVTMLDIPTVPASTVYGAGAGAQCGTDAQCAALAADRASAALGEMTAGATFPVQTVAQVTTTAPPVQLSRQCVRAARDILHASLSRHLRVEEDLSYRGMPRRVGQCNDQLAEAYFADGRQMVNGRHDHRALRTFLRAVIRTGALPADTSNRVTSA